MQNDTTTPPCRTGCDRWLRSEANLRHVAVIVVCFHCHATADRGYYRRRRNPRIELFAEMNDDDTMNQFQIPSTETGINSSLRKHDSLRTLKRRIMMATCCNRTNIRTRSSRPMILLISLLLWCPVYPYTQAVTPAFLYYTKPFHEHPRSKSSRTFRLFTHYDDFQDFDSSMFHSTGVSNPSTSSMSNQYPNATDMYASLRERQATLFPTTNSTTRKTMNRSSSSGSSSTSSRKSSSTTKKTSIGNYMSTRNKQDHEAQDQQKQQEKIYIQNWKDAQCTSTIRLELDDWIRRIAIWTYPLAVVGSSQGHVYLVDLQSGKVLHVVRNVHVADHTFLNPDDQEEEDGADDDDKKKKKKNRLLLQQVQQDKESQAMLDEAMKKLYGPYDGGGVIQLAMYGDIVVSSGREGGVRIFKIQGQEQSYFKGSRGGSTSQTKLQLADHGRLRNVSDGHGRRALITSLVFDTHGILWVGGYDGMLRGYDMDDDETASFQGSRYKPWIEIPIESPILSITINDELGCGVIATSTRGVVLFSLDDGEVLGTWKPFPTETSIKKKKEIFARSAMILPTDFSSNHNHKNNDSWSILCGGSDGRIYQRRLFVDSMGYISEENDFHEQNIIHRNGLDDELSWVLKPSHSAPVVALSSPFPNVFVSGATDGTIRVWDASHDEDWDEFNNEEEEENEDVEEIVVNRNKDTNNNKNNKKKNENDDEKTMSIPPRDILSSLSIRPKCLYALTGYKVWLGSIYTNMKKLVSDGADNTIVVHDFSGEEEEENEIEFSFEEDEEEDDDDDGGLSLK